MKKILVLILVAVMLFSLVSCKKEEDIDESDLIYTEGCEIGEGDTTYYLRFKTEEYDITFTIRTNETNLGRALRQTDIVKGDETEYGLYIKEVNGVRADYDKDQAYWALYIDGEASFYGVDSVDLENGKPYELVYTVG
jgi:hypothetical protein